MASTPDHEHACLLLDQDVRIPRSVSDLASFRRWALSSEFPERGRIDFVGGDLEVDMSPEDVGTHGDPKTAIAVRLGLEIERRDLGRLWIDRTRVTSVVADLSCEPDLVVCLWETLESGRVRLVPRGKAREGRYAELEGGPDLVVEVVSDSSVRKDTERLRARYHAAGVREYWLVDARSKTLRFDVLARRARSFALVARDKRGFARSAVLERVVRLVRKPARLGLQSYRLEMKAPAQRTR